MNQVDLQPFADRINDILAVGVADATPPHPSLWTEDEHGRRLPVSRFRSDLSEYLVWAVVATALLKLVPASVDLLARLARSRERTDPKHAQRLVEDLVTELTRRPDLRVLAAAYRDAETLIKLQEPVRALLDEFRWGPRARADAEKVSSVLVDLLDAVLRDTGPWRRILRIFVSSPSDVLAERETVTKVIDELNRGIAAAEGVYLVAWRWEIDAWPGLHPGGPQGLIDEISRIESADLVIGILADRLGTPVSDAASGTEHELHAAIKTWRAKGRPQVMIYFGEQPGEPRNVVDERERVRAFRSALPTEVFFWTYDSVLQFERVLREHLTQFVRSRVDLR